MLKLSDASERHVDHVLLATGYRVDVSRYPFLRDRILESIRRIDGYPQLDSGFQSSVPGLHFLGAPAAWSFGPLMRFVAGAEFASRRVTRGSSEKSIRMVAHKNHGRGNHNSNLIKHSAHDTAIDSGTCGTLVMGADYRALGVVRSLDEEDPSLDYQPGRSSGSRCLTVCSPQIAMAGRDDGGKVDFLLALCTTHKLNGWMLVPTDDYTVGLVSGHHKVLAGKYQVTVPPWEKLRWACDKRCCISLRRDLRFISRGLRARRTGMNCWKWTVPFRLFSSPLSVCNQAASPPLKPGLPRTGSRCWRVTTRPVRCSPLKI